VNVTLIVEQLRALGVDLSVSSAHNLHSEGPVRTVTDGLRLVDHRKERIEAPVALAPHRAGHDPRPDLTYDAERWAHLLEQALAIDGDNGEGVYWAPLGALCMGAERARELCQTAGRSSS
jgi:hypothetical protein